MHRNRVVRKLLGQPSTTPSDPIDSPTIDFPQLRPSASQSASYSAGSPLTCLDRSPDGQRAIIAGANVIKILRVDGSAITEDFDLRAAITSSNTTNDPTNATAEQFNIGAIKWSHGELSHIVVAASGNGRITIYDLNRAGSGGLEHSRITDHTRQVHKLAINPNKASWFISASHDGTIKSFDIRSPMRKIAQLKVSATNTFKGNAGPIRDVAWSTLDGMEFASATDGGAISKWDLRNTHTPVLTLRHRTNSCYSIAWHPDGEHIISGDSEGNCDVWNFSRSAQKNQKARYSFTVPAPISNLAWRPASWSGTAKARRAAQVAVTYDNSTVNRTGASAVHIWDLARPALPYKAIENWDSSPTGVLWNSRDLLWSVDSQGYFTQTDVAFVPKAVDGKGISTFDFSPTGDTLLFMEERQSTGRVRRSISSQDGTSSYQPDIPTAALGVSRSDSEDDAVTGFLGARRPRHHRRMRSDRSAHQFGTVTSTATGMAEILSLTLVESIGITGSYIPKQVMAFGSAPGAMQKSTYEYYSNAYLHALEAYRKDDSETVPIRLERLMEVYARYATAIGHYRLAQTWRILALAMGKLLVKRAEYHRTRRLAPEQAVEELHSSQHTKSSKRYSGNGMDTPRRFPSGRGVETPARSSRTQTPMDSPLQRPTKSIHFEDRESTSNMTTPLVRPQRDSIVHHPREEMRTSITVENDPLDLAQSTSMAPIPVPIPTNVPQNSRSSVEGYDFYDMESIAAAIPFAAPQKKAPLRLSYDEEVSPKRIQPLRHDSQESFQMFSTSSDSQGTRYMSSSESDGRNSYAQNNHRDLRDRVVDWESSFGSKATESSDGSQENGPSKHTGGEQLAQHAFQPDIPPVLPILRIQEASAPSTQPHPLTPMSATHNREEQVSTPRFSQDPEIITSDYNPWPGDPLFIVEPLDPSSLIQKTINYEAGKGALHSSIFILLLRSLVHEDTIDEYQAPAILRTYHQRLISFQLFLQAASLRNLCVPEYPIIYGSSQQNVTIGFFCTDCRKPIENDPKIPESQWRCPRCKQYLEGCAVCKNQYLLDDVQYPEEDVGTTRNGLWWYCNGCGHGGHITCMKAWHAGPDVFHTGDKYSDGCCPVIGCLHPCLPGKWRDDCAAETAAKNAKALDSNVRELSRNNSISRGATGRGVAVRKDAREVNQSRAVEGVRLALNVASINQAAGTSGGSGGTGNGGVERRRSVKLVAPGDDIGSGSRFNR